MAKRGRPKKVKEVKAVEPVKAGEPVKEPEKQDETPEVKEVKVIEPVKQPEIPEISKGSEVTDNSGLEDRPYFSIDEAARFLGVDDKCARLWFDHGHLKGIEDRGYIRVSRASILRVKVSPLIAGPML